MIKKCSKCHKLAVTKGISLCRDCLRDRIRQEVPIQDQRPNRFGQRMRPLRQAVAITLYERDFGREWYRD